jgi:hypothetical protein
MRRQAVKRRTTKQRGHVSTPASPSTDPAARRVLPPQSQVLSVFADLRRELKRQQDDDPVIMAIYRAVQGKRGQRTPEQEVRAAAKTLRIAIEIALEQLRSKALGWDIRAASMYADGRRDPHRYDRILEAFTTGLAVARAVEASANVRNTLRDSSPKTMLAEDLQNILESHNLGRRFSRVYKKILPLIGFSDVTSGASALRLLRRARMKAEGPQATPGPLIPKRRTGAKADIAMLDKVMESFGQSGRPRSLARTNLSKKRREKSAKK